MCAATHSVTKAPEGERERYCSGKKKKKKKEFRRKSWCFREKRKRRERVFQREEEKSEPIRFIKEKRNLLGVLILLCTCVIR